MMEFIVFVIIFVIPVALMVSSYSKGQRDIEGKKKIECPNCGYEGPPKKYTKGSTAVEIVLWLFILIPGIIYSVWRKSSRYDGCPKCGYQHVVRE